jgi:putative ABC transport system substrate-binding protein
MRRRGFIRLFGAAAAGWPLAARAQQRKKVARIGYLATAFLESPDALLIFNAFRKALSELGYSEGRDIVIDTRSAGGRIERFPALARELVGLDVDVIVTLNSVSARAAQRATATIPIVVAVMSDPVGDGLVASLARPGGNVTGLTFLAPELVPKLLALLREAMPRASRIAALWHPRAYAERTMSLMTKQTEAAAGALGVTLRFIAVQGPNELEGAFSMMVGDRTEALIVFPSPMLFNERRQIVELATKIRLPLIANSREFAQLGGLMAYGANIIDLNRRAAIYVDKILRGAKPGDLPVEQPTKFELVINLNAAKALGLTVSETVLVRADEVLD